MARNGEELLSLKLYFISAKIGRAKKPQSYGFANIPVPAPKYHPLPYVSS